MAQEQFYGEISDAIVNLDEEKAIELAKRAITEKWNLLEVIEKGYGDGIRRIGDLWEEGEFYFKADGPKVFKSRFPNKGTIKLQRNQNFTSKADMNIWSQFKTVKVGREAVERITIILREQDHLKKDSTIAEEEYVINLPSKTQYVILQDDKEETKAKLRIQASRTRY
ncbi:unnamed protein product [marine sediment metagenome]|uniref:B12-binding N-terminal domain-containing protein n=1 Tax=marine sediment metagenome TaxID=412755 RepID=X1BKN7_9ZZZZ